MSLTDVAVRTAKPKDKSYKLSDGGGMYLEVSPKGGKWWTISEFGDVPQVYLANIKIIKNKAIMPPPRPYCW